MKLLTHGGAIAAALLLSPAPLNSVAINIFNAQSGDLLVAGEWKGPAVRQGGF